MTRFRQFWYSVVEYRPDPAAPESGRIPLGVVVGAMVGRLRLVGIAARNALTQDELRRLDGVGRGILKNPYETFRADIEQALREIGIGAPLRILERLASQNQWSLFVSTPSKLELTVPEGRAKKAALDAALRGLYAQKILGISIPGPLAKAPNERELFANVPPYMIPQTLREFAEQAA